MTELKNPGPIEFEGLIKDTPDSKSYIEFPYDLKETYGKGNLVPVVITFDGRVKYTGSLAKRGSPDAYIFLRKDIDAQIGKKPGQKVHVRVDLDTSVRKVELGRDEEAALKKAGLLEKFRSLAFTHQREYHQWITEAKKPETRTARITRMLQILKQK